MKLRKYLPIGLAGLTAGAINGLFGAGGGMVLVPLLTWLTDLEDAEVFPNIDSLLAAAPEDAFVIGGESVYRALLDKCDTAYVTKILTSFPADRHFPDLDKLPDWAVSETGEILEEDGIRFQYITYHHK